MEPMGTSSLVHGRATGQAEAPQKSEVPFQGLEVWGLGFRGLGFRV